MYKPVYQRRKAKAVSSPLHSPKHGDIGRDPLPNFTAMEFENEARNLRKQQGKYRRKKVLVTKKPSRSFQPVAPVHRASWNDSTKIKYQPKPSPIFQDQSSRRRRLYGRGLRSPRTKFLARKALPDEPSKTGDVAGNNASRQTAGEKNAPANSSNNKGCHSCINSGCCRKIVGPATFAKANCMPMPTFRRYRKSKSVAFRASLSRSEQNCSSGRCHRQPSDAMFKRQDDTGCKPSASCTSNQRYTRRKSGRKQSKSTSCSDMAAARNDRSCQYPWDSERYAPVRSRSDVSKVRGCSPCYDNAPCYSPSWMPDDHGAMGKGRSMLSEYCRKLSSRHFQDDRLPNPDLASCFERLDAIKSSQFFQNSRSNVSPDYTSNAGGILKSDSRNIRPFCDSVESCSKALSNLRLRELNLLDRYRAPPLESYGECRDDCSRKGLSSHALPYSQPQSLLRSDHDPWLDRYPSLAFDTQSRTFDRYQQPTAPYMPYTPYRANTFSDNRYATSRSRQRWINPVAYSSVLSVYQPARSPLGDRWTPRSWERPRPFSATIPRAEYSLINKYLDIDKDNKPSQPASDTKLKPQPSPGRQKSEVAFEGDVTQSNSQCERRARSSSHSMRVRRKSLDCCLDTAPNKAQMDRPACGQFQGLKHNKRWKGADNTSSYSHDHSKPERSLLALGRDGLGNGKSSDVVCVPSSLSARLGSDSGGGYARAPPSTPRPASVASSAGGLSCSSKRPAKSNTFDSCLQGEQDRLKKLDSMIS